MTRHIFHGSARLCAHAARINGTPVNMPPDEAYDPVLEQYERDHQSIVMYRRENPEDACPNFPQG